jgi:hypothetical protein
MKMIGKLLRSEELNAATVLALSGTIIVLMTKGDDSVSLKRIVSGVLSNPVPRPVAAGVPDTGVSALRATQMRIAA